MKSIICVNSSSNVISFIFVILACILSILCSPPCGLYGAPPCQFLPAPRGQTPACARPGKTYCEHIDNYPTYLIKRLVHKWGYEAKNLLIDETWDDFAAVAWHETPVFYDPAFIFPQRHPNNNGNDFNGYKYETPHTDGNNNNIGKVSTSNTFFLTKQQVTEPPTYLLYSSAGQRLNFNLNKNILNPLTSNLKVSQNNPTFWLKRIVRDIVEKKSDVTPAKNATAAATTKITSSNTTYKRTARNARDVSFNMDLFDVMGVEKDSKLRTKRQTPGRSTLCSTTSQFIVPQAALNSKGNWMFVVNEANTARQMVRAELCASNTCSNLCSLPNGYNSRCEQKFVQKRLIALQGNGQNLYTDTFWFPSCCVCTISSNSN